jgi:hypothetical protein
MPENSPGAARQSANQSRQAAQGSAGDRLRGSGRRTHRTAVEDEAQFGTNSQVLMQAGIVASPIRSSQ